MASCTSSYQFKTTNQSIEVTDRENRVVYVDDSPLKVEVVSTPQSTQQGLSGRSEIGADGMLFVFSTVEERSFWMKEMLFDIDIVWIKEGVVTGVNEQVPAPNVQTSLQDLPLYSSNEPVDMVLELPAGDATKRDIKVGTRLRFE